jgi:hypothetical protein
LTITTCPYCANGSASTWRTPSANPLVQSGALAPSKIVVRARDLPSFEASPACLSKYSYRPASTDEALAQTVQLDSVAQQAQPWNASTNRPLLPASCRPRGKSGNVSSSQIQRGVEFGLSR